MYISTFTAVMIVASVALLNTLDLYICISIQLLISQYFVGKSKETFWLNSKKAYYYYHHFHGDLLE
jgi:hypothetical protein